MNTYAEKLKDPRWQKKRLEILQRDSFECQCCNDNSTELVVHHKKYTRKNIWEEPDENLIALCKNCHEKFHTHLEDRYSNESYYIPYRLKEITTTDLFIIEHRFFYLVFKYGSDAGRRIIESLKSADFNERNGGVK